jgi:hypothetical protein
MTHDQVIIEALGQGPRSLPQIACALHVRGSVSLDQMYAVARTTITDMMTAKRIEICGEGLNTCWRLPANMQMEKRRADAFRDNTDA